jgi:hypothetical protein
MELLHAVYELLLTLPVQIFANEWFRIVLLHDNIGGIEFIKSIQDVACEDRQIQVAVQCGNAGL